MRIIALALIAFTVILAGCQNTVEGFGKDMQRSGQEIQKAVN